MEHENQNIIVTGASRGIGAGIAELLASRGARLAITYTTKRDAAEAISKKLPGKGHFIVQLDQANEESVEKAFTEILSKFDQSLHGLVNNAGITRDGLLLRMKSEDFDQVLQTNLRGAFLCTRAALKPMMKSKGGSIVNMSSVIGHTGNAGQANYAASKGGLEAFTKSIAQEMASRNIRVNAVAPGFIVTDMTDNLGEKQKQLILDKIPMQRLGSVVDVAEAVSFLLSSASSYITGQSIGVNGGMYM